MASRRIARMGAVALALGIAGAALWVTRGQSDPADDPAARESGETMAAPTAAATHAGRPLEPDADHGTARSTATGPASEPRLAETRLGVTVISAENFAKKAARVPGVPFVVGVGVRLDPRSDVLEAGVTNTQGEAVVDLPWAAIEAARGKAGSQLWVRVVGPGFEQRSRGIALPESPESPEPAELRCIARGGGTVFGRLLDESGAPLAGELSVYEGLAAGELGFTACWSEGAGDDGRFALHFGREGVYQILAEAGAYGTGALADYDVRFSEPPAEIELVASGPGIVRGRVLDALGNPALGLDLLLLVASLDDPSGSFVLPEPAASHVRMQGRGRHWATLRTDAEGAFEARGLRADLYVVRARTGGSSYPHLLTPLPLPTDGEPAELRMHRPHVLVRVVDHEGRPWTEALGVNGRGRSGAADEWPDKPTVVLAAAAAEARLLEDGQDFDARLYAGRGEVVFEVPDVGEDRAYLVGLIGGRSHWQPHEILVPAGGSRVEVTLTVSGPQEPMGELVVSAFDAAGKVLERDVAIEIADAASGLPLVVKDSFYRTTWPVRFELPEGRYRVAVEGAPSIDFYHGVLWRPVEHGRYETEVTVVPDRPALVLATLPSGARLRVHLVGESNDADRARVLARGWSPGEGELELLARRAELALLPTDATPAWPRPAWFTIEYTGSSAAGTHLTDELELGCDETSQILPAGQWILQARLPGGRVATAPIVLNDGVTTEVRLVFE